MPLTAQASPATAGPPTGPGAELAALRHAAAAFISQATAGATVYNWPDGHPHYMTPVSELPAHLIPATIATADGPLTQAQQHAAWLAGTIRAALWFAGGTATQTWRHYPAALDPGRLAALPLPQPATPGQPATLLDSTGPGPLEHHLHPATLHAAQTHRPRTCVLEDIGHGQPDHWATHTSTHLTRLTPSPPITCSVYQSRHRDHTLPTHQDAWFGVIVQITGHKHWHLGHPTSPTQPPAQATIPGDLLLIPKHLPHHATTPENPGHSLHLTFTLDRDHA